MRGRRSPMTFWSSKDPVMVAAGEKADHWSKMKIRAMSASGVGGNTTTLDMIDKLKKASMKTPAVINGDGRFDPVAHQVFNEVKLRSMHGDIPGNCTCPDYARPKSMPAPKSKTSLRTSYNEKARQGVKYWYQDRPKPTKFGRYGIGSYKTVLGVGNGPRT